MIGLLYKYVAAPFWLAASALFAFGLGLVVFACPVYFAVVAAVATGHTVGDRGFYAWAAGGAFVGLVFAVTVLHRGDLVTVATLRGDREVPHVREK